MVKRTFRQRDDALLLSFSPALSPIISLAQSRLLSSFTVLADGASDGWASFSLDEAQVCAPLTDGRDQGLSDRLLNELGKSGLPVVATEQKREGERQRELGNQA